MTHIQLPRHICHDSWDIKTAYFLLMLTLWPQKKFKCHQQWYTCIDCDDAYIDIKFDQISYHSLSKTCNAKVSTTILMFTNYLPLTRENSTKLNQVKYYWYTSYQVAWSWHAWFLRYWNCLSFLNADLVTLREVKGHQQWHMRIDLDGVYNHAKFDKVLYQSLNKKSKCSHDSHSTLLCASIFSLTLWPSVKVKSHQSNAHL